jgi:hypothetical protein
MTDSSPALNAIFGHNAQHPSDTDTKPWGGVWQMDFLLTSVILNP